VSKLFVGIDPGFSGAMVIIEKSIISTIKFKEMTVGDLVWHIKNLKLKYDYQPEIPMFIFMEQVHPLPLESVKGVWTFASSYWSVYGALLALNIKFETVHPIVWQKKLGCIYKGSREDKKYHTKKKNKHKDLAQKLFPEYEVTHATADALLIAEYARRVHG